jgi:hypothetical protein
MVIICCNLIICDTVFGEKGPLGKGVNEGEVDGRFAGEIL